MNNELSGRVALVTGASRGIGSAITVAVAQAGADVAVNFVRHEAEAKEVCSRIDAITGQTISVNGGWYMS